jgi:hypothetical protein
MSRARFTAPTRSICRVLGLLALAFLVGCGPEPTDLPPEILGDWTTDAPSYRNRHFEIRTNAIVFGTGEFSADLRHSLVGSETKPGSDGWTDCVLRYREPDGGVSDLGISYRTRPREELRFAHRKEVWTRRVNRKGGDV